MQDDGKVYFVVHGKLTTTPDNNLGEVRMAELPDILITVAKCRVRTHHNALRFSTVSHQTVGLAPIIVQNNRQKLTTTVLVVSF